MTNNTARAITATRTIEQLGGLQRATWGTSLVEVYSIDVENVLGLFAKLHLDVPAELADALETTAQLAQRAHQLRTAPPVFDRDDLAADDYAVRFNAAMTGKLRTLAKAESMIDAAKTTAVTECAAVVRKLSPALIDLLNTAYPQHAEAEHHGSGPGIHEVHRTLLAWQPGATLGSTLQDYAAVWCVKWAWKQDAWNTLVNETRAQMDLPPGTDSYSLAIQCGGKPYLTPTTKDAAERAYAHRAAYQDWAAQQHAEARRNLEREQFEASVAQAEAVHHRARSAQEAIEAALAAAEAAAN